MPTYQYKCPNCGHEYEKLQKITDNARAKCPNCGKRGERVISGGGGLIFKGSGFYITDYKNKGGERDKAEKAEKAEGAGKTGETGKTEKANKAEKADRADKTEKKPTEKSDKPKPQSGADS